MAKVKRLAKPDIGILNDDLYPSLFDEFSSTPAQVNTVRQKITAIGVIGKGRAKRNHKGEGIDESFHRGTTVGQRYRTYPTRSSGKV
ncbi:hypothetical protein [Acetivibrio clariflavus]|uniref:hypothetical protein n=1 Tax=Acetivibrio clariflavus TaxID=288965 RepID=UPI0004B607A4|nr:hypothetical protein [Acetivibrio clariflavus]